MIDRLAVNSLEISGWIGLAMAFLLFTRIMTETQIKSQTDSSLRRRVNFLAHLSEVLGVTLFLGGVYFLHYYPAYKQGFMILGVMGCYAMFTGMASLNALKVAQKEQLERGEQVA